MPRPVAVFIAMSLDGRIAGPNDDISWLNHDLDYGYEDFYAEVDAVVMGRKTFESTISLSSEYPYEGVEAVVFSSDPAKKHEKARFTSEPISKVVGALTKKPGKTVWIVGGSDVISECLSARLVTDVRLFVHPLVVGAGKPLFRDGMPRIPLTLVSAMSFGTGVVELRYRA